MCDEKKTTEEVDAIVQSQTTESDVIIKSQTTESDVIVQSQTTESDVIVKSQTTESDVIVKSQTTDSDVINPMPQLSDPAQIHDRCTNGHTDGRIPVKVEVVSTDEESEDKEKNKEKAPLGSYVVDDEVSFKSSASVTFAAAAVVIEERSNTAEKVESNMEVDEIATKPGEASEITESEKFETETETVKSGSDSEIEPKNPEADAEVHRSEIQINISKPAGSKNDLGLVEFVVAFSSKSNESEAVSENENNENADQERAELIQREVIASRTTNSVTTESTEVSGEVRSQKEIEVADTSNVNVESEVQPQTVELKNDEENETKLVEVNEVLKISKENNTIELEASKAVDSESVSKQSELLISKMSKLQVESANETCSG